MRNTSFYRNFDLQPYKFQNGQSIFNTNKLVRIPHVDPDQLPSEASLSQSTLFIKEGLEL